MDKNNDKTDHDNDSDKLLGEELDNELKDLSDFSLSDMDIKDILNDWH